MTTRVAFVSDVHADVLALRDALAQATRLGCELVVCAGDVVDYGHHPVETVALLHERGIPTIRGNHDRWALARRQAARSTRTSREQDDTPTDSLPQRTLEILAASPLSWSRIIEGVRVVVAHGTPRSDMDGIYPDQATLADVERWLREATADVLIVGHTHLAFELRTPSGVRIANPGALLRDGAERVHRAFQLNPETSTFGPAAPIVAGTFGVLELPSRRFTVHRAVDGEEVDIPRIEVGVRDRRAGR